MQVVGTVNLISGKQTRGKERGRAILKFFGRIIVRKKKKPSRPLSPGGSEGEQKRWEGTKGGHGDSRDRVPITGTSPVPESPPNLRPQSQSANHGTADPSKKGEQHEVGMELGTLLHGGERLHP